MSTGVSDGADELRQLGAALKAAGDKVMRKEVIDSLKQATGPIGDDVRAEAARTFGRRGGLADIVANTKVTTKVRLAGRQAGVRIVGRNTIKQLEATDLGSLRHPLWGNKSHWRSQSIRPGWWSRPIEERAPQIRDDLRDAVHQGLKRAVR